MKNFSIMSRYAGMREDLVRCGDKVKKMVIFIFALLIMLVYLLPKESMIDISGDAADIWQTITTYGTEEMYGSYVLYKGVESLFPYVWLYQFAVFLHFNEWIFIKLFYCICFAYVTAIGFPKLYVNLFEKETKAYRVGIFCVICFWLWEKTYAFSQLMIDLPSLCYFILLINTAFVLKRKNSLWGSVWFALLAGLNLCASGQYTMPTICIFVFVIIELIHQVKQKQTSWQRCLANLVIIFVLALGIRQANLIFIQTMKEELASKGIDLFTSGTWLKIGFVRFMRSYRVGVGQDILGTRKVAILKEYFGDAFATNESSMLMGGFAMTIPEYIKMFASNPHNFILCYLNAFFLVLSPDGGCFSLWRLLAFYSAIFVAVRVGYKRCTYFKQIFNSKFWVGFAFLWAMVPLLIMNVEARFCMQIQGLILVIALCDDLLWDGIQRLIIAIKNKENIFANGRVPYHIVLYVIFVVFCLMHMGSMYELSGDDVNILLTFRC